MFVPFICNTYCHRTEVRNISTNRAIREQNICITNFVIHSGAKMIGEKLIKGQMSIKEIAVYKRNPKNNYKFELEKLREYESKDTNILF